MCSPHDSTGWIKEWQAIHPKMENAKLKNTSQWENKGQNDGASYNWHKNNPKFWNDLYEQIPHMYQLYFAGGESLIIDEHYDLLEECIRRGNAKNIDARVKQLKKQRENTENKYDAEKINLLKTVKIILSSSYLISF
jgi:hypothetical protein